MASNNLIASYKGHVLDPIYKELKSLGVKMPKKRLENKMKVYTGVVKGCDEMTDDEIRYHSEGCKAYSALELDLKIDFEKDDKIDFNPNR